MIFARFQIISIELTLLAGWVPKDLHHSSLPHSKQHTIIHVDAIDFVVSRILDTDTISDRQDLPFKYYYHSLLDGPTIIIIIHLIVLLFYESPPATSCSTFTSHHQQRRHNRKKNRTRINSRHDFNHILRTRFANSFTKYFQVHGTADQQRRRLLLLRWCCCCVAVSNVVAAVVVVDANKLRYRFYPFLAVPRKFTINHSKYYY